jgi:hypothetical protein
MDEALVSAYFTQALHDHCAKSTTLPSSFDTWTARIDRFFHNIAIMSDDNDDDDNNNNNNNAIDDDDDLRQFELSHSSSSDAESSTASSSLASSISLDGAAPSHTSSTTSNSSSSSKARHKSRKTASVSPRAAPTLATATLNAAGLASRKVRAKKAATSQLAGSSESPLHRRSANFEDHSRNDGPPPPVAPAPPADSDDDDDNDGDDLSDLSDSPEGPLPSIDAAFSRSHQLTTDDFDETRRSSSHDTMTRESSSRKFVDMLAGKRNATGTTAAAAAKSSKGKGASWKLSHLVSKKKKRYIENGFDLDLTYVTERIIAMGFPAEGREGMYRNSFKETYRFLTTNHGGHFAVVNLCCEPDRQYDVLKFGGAPVFRYGFEDHNPPSLDVVVDFCRACNVWLDANPSNVLAIHCKAGKGRTGTMIACLLVDRYADKNITALDALQYYAKQRTHDEKGVTISSQQRYVRYFAALVQRRHELPPGSPAPLPRTPRRIRLLKLVMIGVRSVGGTYSRGADEGADLSPTHSGSPQASPRSSASSPSATATSVSSSAPPSTLATSAAIKGMSVRVLVRKETERIADGEPAGMRCGTPVPVGAAAVDLAFGDTVEFHLDFIVAGDCKVVVENAKREPMFHFWFNTSMVDMNTDGKAVLNLSKVALDGALAKDKSSKLVQESFRIELLMVRCKGSSAKAKESAAGGSRAMAASAAAAASRNQRSMSVMMSSSAAAAPTSPTGKRQEALSDDNKSADDDDVDDNNNDDDDAEDASESDQE